MLELEATASLDINHPNMGWGMGGISIIPLASLLPDHSAFPAIQPADIVGMVGGKGGVGRNANNSVKSVFSETRHPSYEILAPSHNL